mmetsp:Transcript_19369/g.55755  ORF Transcript_19369/g.55755 Transcript_19369/m.55755 type:complete len:483 (+) Transcript_19369:88-1536(+)
MSNPSNKHASTPPRPTKKARCADDPPLLSQSPAGMFFFLYEDDLAGLMFKFASINCLCKLDAACKRSWRLTPNQWADRTMNRFGMSGGKGDWIRANRLLRKPIFTPLHDEGDFGYGDMFSGSPDVASNGNLVVAVTDDGDEASAWDRTFPGERDAIAFRDASSLNFMKLLSSPISNWKVAICGRTGSEIIVTSDAIRIAARRGNDVQVMGFDPAMRDGNGLPLLGCETHLLSLVGNRIKLFQVGPGTSNDLLILCQDVCVVGENTPVENSSSGFAWDNDKTHFVFACPQSEQLQIWRLDAAESKVSCVQTINVTGHLSINNVSIAGDFVAASCQMKKLHIWDRKSGTKMHTLCDVSKDEELEEDEAIHPLGMKTYGGSILVSTSHLGNALCIWNMKSGRLLKKHHDAQFQGQTDLLPDGIDVTGMTYVDTLNAFVCMTGYMTVWAFPITERQVDMMKSIQRREKWISRAAALQKRDEESDSA